MYPVSYHTFLFPFIWNSNGKLTPETFMRHLPAEWKQDLQQKELRHDLYSQYCYFNQAARNVIFTTKGDLDQVVYNYRFDFGALLSNADWLQKEKDEKNPVRYSIQKGKKTYELAINGVRLRLFSTGVGMLVYELENYSPATEADINTINDYGRRIYQPFLDLKNTCSICADALSITYPGGQISSPIAGALPQSNTHIRYPDIITYFLGKATLTPSDDKKRLPLQAILDDRMFVSCVWNNGDFPREMHQFANGEYIYLTDALEKAPAAPDNTARRLYELIFIDGDGITCRSRTMLREMLEKHIYHRWLEYSEEYGTIAGISEFSLVTVTSDPIAINAHLADYTEMAMLVLVQRATLLRFEQRISDCARGKGRIGQLQRQYVRFQSKYLLREVTPQQQGIEMYRMLTDHLFIEDMKNDVDSQISALFDVEQSHSERDDNFLLFVLAGITLFDAINFLISGWNWWSLCSLACVTVAMLVLYIFNHRNRIK